ncbi:unknown [Bacteroides sp. CAG:754]|jgi:hypothetical protein|nr:unknown [Bacteroides sp. CAG:754]
MHIPTKILLIQYYASGIQHSPIGKVPSLLLEKSSLGIRVNFQGKNLLIASATPSSSLLEVI